MPRIFSVPFEVPFLNALAAYVRKEEDPFKQASKIIFLPTRQACLELKAILLEHSGNFSSLLPQFIPLGEIDKDEISLKMIARGLGAIDLPPLITEERRKFLLATLLLQFQRMHYNLSFPRTLDLANDLIQLIDELRSKEIPLPHLHTLDPNIENAEHWHHILSFLKIISEHWDRILKEEGVIEPISYLTLLRDFQIKNWEMFLPQGEIIIAGSQGTIHSTEKLMKCVLTLPQGTIILQGYDEPLDGKEYPELPMTHPQYQHYMLLKNLEILPEQVQSLETRNSKLIRDVPQFSPPHAVEFYEALDAAEEAQIVALKIREILEHRTGKILCLSHSRILLDRISMELKRWDIAVTPHKGKKLITSLWGSFVLNAAAGLKQNFSWVNFLSFIKHPLSNIPREWILALELNVRDSQARSLDYLEQALSKKEDELKGGILDFIGQYKEIMRGTDHSLFEKHIKLLEWALGIKEGLESFLEVAASSESLATLTFLRNIKGTFFGFDFMESSYEETLLKLMEEITFCPKEDTGFNIFLMTPPEARLLTADYVILAGMNEGCWPLKPSPDALLSRSFKITLGLNPKEKAFGQSAHDFLSALSIAPTLITRSSHENGALAIPSRLLVGLKSHLSPENNPLPSSNLSKWRSFLLFSHPSLKLSPPAPCPEISLRPTTYTVTDIETLSQDPYTFYAKRILCLSKLKTLSQEPAEREFGIFIHIFLEEWNSLKSLPLKSKLEKKALPIFDLLFYGSPIKDFWWQKFSNILNFLIPLLEANTAQKTYCEVNGILRLNIENKTITIKGRADRIDIYEDGITILDYKTGAVPLLSSITNGTHPQIGIEAAIYLFGVFQNIDTHKPIKSLEIWSLARGNKSHIMGLNLVPSDLAVKTRTGVESLLTFFLKESPYLSYPWGNFLERNYTHLARVSEWKQF